MSCLLRYEDTKAHWRRGSLAFWRSLNLSTASHSYPAKSSLGCMTHRRPWKTLEARPASPVVSVCETSLHFLLTVPHLWWQREATNFHWHKKCLQQLQPLNHKTAHGGSAGAFQKNPTSVKRHCFHKFKTGALHAASGKVTASMAAARADQAGGQWLENMVDTVDSHHNAQSTCWI